MATHPQPPPLGRPVRTREDGWDEDVSPSTLEPPTIPNRNYTIPPEPTPSKLKRYQNFGHDHFITFSCYRRLPFLDNDSARITFLEELDRLRTTRQFYVSGYLLISEHVHPVT